jgi:LysM repeat protein
MRYIHLLLIVLTSALLFSCKSIGQINAPVEKIDGKEFYMHTVQKKQTLYAIAGLYKIEMNDLLSANPGSDAGIKEGQIIKVPVAKTAFAKTNESSLLLHEVQKKETLFSIAEKYNIEVNDLIAANPGSDAGIKKGQFLRIPQAKKEVEPATTGNYTEHTVVAGETLYSLSVRYKVKVDEIKKINNLSSDTLKEGMLLRIPGEASPKNDKVEVIEEPVFVLGGPKEEYKIALMLPFYTQFGDSASMDSRDLLQREASLDIYRGILIAIDSLEAMGLKADLYIYDVLDGKTAIEQILKKPEMTGMDLIIGPTFRDPIKAVVDFSTRYGVPVVCPTPQSNKNTLISSESLQGESFFCNHHGRTRRICSARTSQRQCDSAQQQTERSESRRSEDDSDL